MYMRHKSTVQVLSFTPGTDAYGMVRKNGFESRDVVMDFYLYVPTNNDTPEYVDCDAIGLTNDSTITTSNQIIHDNIKYDVKYVIPTPRKNQILMKKVVQYGEGL